MLENKIFTMVLEDDGCILDMEVLDAVFQQQENIGPIMFLKDGEIWSPGNTEWCMFVTGRNKLCNYAMMFY